MKKNLKYQLINNKNFKKNLKYNEIKLKRKKI